MRLRIKCLFIILLKAPRSDSLRTWKRESNLTSLKLVSIKLINLNKHNYLKFICLTDLLFLRSLAGTFYVNTNFVQLSQ